MKIVASTAIALACAGALFVTTAPSKAGSGRDLSSVNGSVDTNAGQSYDSVSSVNGDVHLETGASAEIIKTVNGNVVLDADASAGSARTVNGSLRVHDGATISHDATTVNGGVDVGRNARVGGNVTTVSGDIKLAGAEIQGGLQTSNGDIDLRDGARVHGGILVKEKSGDWSWREDRDHPVKVNICATCEVAGELHFERAVVLHVEPGAKIGNVVGDHVVRR